LHSAQVIRALTGGLAAANFLTSMLLIFLFLGFMLHKLLNSLFKIPEAEIGSESLVSVTALIAYPFSLSLATALSGGAFYQFFNRGKLVPDFICFIIIGLSVLLGAHIFTLAVKPLLFQTAVISATPVAIIRHIFKFVWKLWQAAARFRMDFFLKKFAKKLAMSFLFSLHIIFLLVWLTGAGVVIPLSFCQYYEETNYTDFNGTVITNRTFFLNPQC
jgi:hypothetical protein